MTYRPEIDGLRAIAVLSVVAYHVAPAALRGGYLGVDVFFVISGFLITSLLRREWVDTGRISLGDFYARRIRRIVPALLAVVCATVALSYFLLPHTHELTVTSSIAALLFVANLYFRGAEQDYFAQESSETPLLHLWSLGVEEQFYLLWPLLLLVCMRRRPGAWIAVLLGASLALWLRDPSDFYWTPARFWELAAGGLIAFAPPATRWRRPASLVALLLVLVTIAVDGGAILAVAGSSALMLCARRDESAGRILSSRPLVAIGLISYSLYLWHWPLLAIYEVHSLGDPSIAVRSMLAGVAIVLAALSYRFIEVPFRRVRAPTRKVLVRGALALSVATASVSAAIPPLPPETAATGPMPGCHWGAHAHLGADVMPCLHGEGPPRTVLWGDSHAQAWRPVAERIASMQGSSLVSLTKDGCRPSVTPAAGLNPESCDEFNATVLRRIAELQPVAVVLAARWVGYPSDGIAETIAALPGRVVVIGPTPQLRYRASECIRLGRPEACDVPRLQHQKETAGIWRALQGTTADTVDPAEYICASGSCLSALPDGTPLYHDTNHITRTTAEAVAARIGHGVNGPDGTTTPDE